MRNRKPGGVRWCLIIVFFGVAPLMAQQDPPAPACCQDIFYAGYNLGCAATMCDWQYADESLSTFLNNGARFIARAYSDCSRLNPAWPNWRQYSGDLERLANRLGGRVGADDFRTAAGWLQSLRDGLADDLRVQIVASRYEARPTCEEYYYRFGYDLGSALISITIAGSDSLDGDSCYRAHEDALNAIYRARVALDNLSRVRPVTGACVDLVQLRGFLENVYPSPTPAQAGPIRATLQDVVARAETLLAGCGRGGGATGISPQAAAGWWNVVFLRRGGDGRFFIESQEQIELTTNRGQFGMYMGQGRDNNTSEWYIVGNELRIVDIAGTVRMRYRYIDESTWLLLEMVQGTEIINVEHETDLRIQLQR